MASVVHVMERYEANSGLKKALSTSRQDVIRTVRESGIRGRGGAGFPTAVKWNLCAAAQFHKKFIVCNADEGEPGTFKDRLLLAERTDALFDGITIGGYAIGATLGVIYLRAEYSYMRAGLDAKLEERRHKGLSGKNILGSGFDLDIEIRMGAG
ncbi:iron hydrogenase, partial [candidate division WOR-3 bacterium]|nr:iron hydrogenase [candidate division WOR-3 bacterium]